MKIWILIMALMANGRVLEADGSPALGDAAFYRVDTRTPAHELPPGVAADATNKRFEDGRAWPRLAVVQEPWGVQWGPNLVPVGATVGSNGFGGGYLLQRALVKGRKYVLLMHQVPPTPQQLFIENADWAGGSTFYNPVYLTGKLYVPVYFTAAGDSLLVEDTSLIGTSGVPVTFSVQEVLIQNPRGYHRFSDPNGFDVTVVVTDDWRNGPGEDGGRGRAWKEQSGNAPQPIPLNGHDVYCPVCLAPCYNGLALLRDGDERHYFPAANIAPGGAAGEITLNCEPAWNNGDAVLYSPDLTVGSTLTGGTTMPGANTIVYVKSVSATVWKLYKDSGCSTAYDFTGGSGRFYLERQATSPGYFGNGAPPWLAQPDVIGNTLFDVGFLAVPADVFVTAVSGDKKTITAPNHRLIPGDRVAYYDATAAATTNYYVNPVNTNLFNIYDTQDDALAASVGNGTAGQLALVNGFNAANFIAKVGASSMPMPPARLGFYTDNNQLVLLNQRNNIIVSDPLDPLHYTPLSAELTANLGESDSVTAIGQLSGTDTLVIGKENSIMALYNFSGGQTEWALRSVTREYGCIAPVMKQAGGSLFFMSRRGLDRVSFSIVGGVIATVKPVSYAMQKYINLVDWNNAEKAVVDSWNNRLFLAYPLKGQSAGSVMNNQVLSLNFLNSDIAKDEWGWEGGWSGAALRVFGFARHVVNGEERLTFCDYNGNVNWLADGWQDATAAGTLDIADRLLTRIYTGGGKGRKIWTSALVTWDTNNALLTVTAVTPGYNERETLTQAGGLAYDRTKYNAGEGPDYNPATQTPPFGNAGRLDYSLAGPGELIGGVPDAHQNIGEPFRMREDDWGVQLEITNARGSARIQSVSVGGFVGPSSERRIV